MKEVTVDDWAQNAFGILLVIQAGWMSAGSPENAEKAEKLDAFLHTAPPEIRALGALSVLQQMVKKGL